MAWSQMDMGIDLGTENIRVFVRGRGVVIDERSVVAVHARTGQFLEAGNRASEALYKDPYERKLIKPISAGAISRYDGALMILRWAIARAIGGAVIRPRVVLSAPSRATDVERRALRQAAMEAGAREIAMIEAPMAAAIGAGIDVFESTGHMVVDIGAGVTDIGVIAIGGLVAGDRLDTGGDSFDKALIRYVRSSRNLMLGDRAAECMKAEVGAAHGGVAALSMIVHGRDLASGLPREASVTSQEISEALSACLRDISDAVRCVIEATPPELIADISEHGILLTGGASRLRGIADCVGEAAGVRALVAPDPARCVINGLGRFAEGMDLRVTSSVKRV
ncbi:MAG: rod shape-determining protein [Clostridia bacterium]|nr:rod shape-determining protein [Clostridia bacterium]